jgi:hypothetical protein
VLKLDIPQQAPESDTSVDARPAHTARWLAELPLLEPAEYARRVLERLGSVNRTALTPRKRLRLLEVFDEPVHYLSADLNRRHASLGAPFSDAGRDYAAMARALHAETACGYKIVLMDLAWRGGPRLDMPTVADAVHRALCCLTDVLANCYRVYAPAPEGIWQEIHQLYLYADNLGILKQPVENRGGGSILHAYTAALLLGLSNPYQMPFQFTAAVQGQLRDWAKLASLRAEPKPRSKRCQFLVPLGSDRPGYPCQGDAAMPPAEPHIALDTRRLVRKLHDELQAISPAEDPGSEADSRQTPNGERRRDLLQRLIIAWGISPSRRFSRAPKTVNAEIVVGIEAVARSLAGEQPPQASGPEPDAEIILTSNSQPSADVSPKGFPATGCRLRDEGPNGVGLTVLETDALDVRVGNVVAVRLLGRGAAWTVGLVRWIRSDAPGQLQLGIQKLAPMATSVLVEPVSVESANRRDYKPAILLPDVPALNQPQTLIAHHGSFRPLRNFFVETSDALRMVRAGRLLETGPSFDWFELSVLDI